MAVRVVDTWEVAAIGSVVVAVSDRARHTRITLKRDGTVKLTVPRLVPLEHARRFLESKLPWIQRHRESFSRMAELPAISRTEARWLLTARVRELAALHGFHYNRVSVRSQRTLWGSCSSRNNINLNINLLRLPEELRDYIILHELVHTRHHNHGKVFWRELDKLVGSGKKLQRKLRSFRLGT
jgi:predicted metal-dependent hydrolase